MKKFDFANPPQWKLEAFCVFAPLCDADGDESEYLYIADCIAECIETENAFDSPDRLEWWDRSFAHDFADDDSRFSDRGTCDHCGAHFAYGAAYRNIVTGEHAIVGHICATNKLNLTADEYARKRAGEMMKRARTKAKADMRVSRLAPNRRDALKYKSVTRNHFTDDVTTDMHQKFRKYGSLSLKQWAFLKRLIAEDIERAEQRAADRANASPITDDLLEGRHTFTGIIRSTKDVENMYGITLKMLFVDDRGFKLFGSVPSSLPYNIGDRVQFDAAIDRSNDDDTFGFFNRPTKSKNLEQTA